MRLKWLPSNELFETDSAIYLGATVTIRTESGGDLGIWKVYETAPPLNRCFLVSNHYRWWAEGLEPLFPDPKYTKDEIIEMFVR